jgi:SAM-dependent methyltransferase
MGFIKTIKRQLNKVISQDKQCYICNTSFAKFGKFRGGTKALSDYEKDLNIIGSDIDNFICLYCSSTDRERHLFMYFDKLNFWDKIKASKILHFAPERKLKEKIATLQPKEHIKGDLMPFDKDMIVIDATAIQFEDNYFDVVICNHVLEHIPDYKKAMKEIWRVLKPNGSAILQTPVSRLLQQNFEDVAINTDKLRLTFYGQEDHARVFSEQQFYKDLAETGFQLNIQKNDSLFDEHTCNRYGVNKKEDLVWVIKPL